MKNLPEWDVYTGEYDAATNLAMDDLLLEKASEKGQRSLRLYSFEDPALILARNEHPDDISEWIEDVDYTRRNSGGSVISCRDNAIYYSIIMPAETGDFPEELHRDYFGPRIAEALSEAGIPEEKLGVGEHFSVRIDGKTVSGNSQRKKRDAVLYHGLIAHEPWDEEYLDEMIELREKNGESEKDFISGLPGISEHTSADKKEVKEYLIQAFTDGAYSQSELDSSEQQRLQELRERYVDDTWIKGENEASLEKDQGFCFVDWTDEWNEDVKEYQHFY